MLLTPATREISSFQPVFLISSQLPRNSHSSVTHTSREFCVVVLFPFLVFRLFVCPSTNAHRCTDRAEIFTVGPAESSDTGNRSLHRFYLISSQLCYYECTKLYRELVPPSRWHTVCTAKFTVSHSTCALPCRSSGQSSHKTKNNNNKKT